MDELEKLKPEQDQGPDKDKKSTLTRRQWFLRLGEGAVLTGFSGVTAEELIALDAHPPMDTAVPALPPGLYEPSGEHMAHVLLRDERFVMPPPGSETEYARAYPMPFKPVFFSAEDFPVVRQLVRLVLNAPSKVGAAAGITPVDAETVNEIAEWIDLVVSEASSVRAAARKLSAQHRALAVNYYGPEAVRQLETADPQATWREGLAWLKQQSGMVPGKDFLGWTEAQQVALLNSIAEPSTEKKKIESSGLRLYRLLKNQTIEGYYTSQAGLKELDYKGNAFYAESPGCSNP